MCIHVSLSSPTAVIITEHSLGTLTCSGGKEHNGVSAVFVCRHAMICDLLHSSRSDEGANAGVIPPLGL